MNFRPTTRRRKAGRGQQKAGKEKKLEVNWELIGIGVEQVYTFLLILQVFNDVKILKLFL